MAIRRPSPKALPSGASKYITEASANQVIGGGTPKSYDPSKYPVFDTPVNSKVLVYIPNHQVQDAQGNVNLRMDKFNAHPVVDGRSYYNVRCISGLSDTVVVNGETVSLGLGYDGTCPLCDGLSEVWDLYHYEYADIARSKGVSVDAPEAQDLLKEDRKKLAHAMPLKKADCFYTFPIVVIDCEEKDGVKTTTPKLDSQGHMNGTPMWYVIRESTFLEKWVAGYDSLEGNVPSNPAGLWAVLNFTYSPKSGNPDKMGSARALKVTFRNNVQQYADWAKYFDKLTEDWTPEKAQEVVVTDVVRSMKETCDVADTVLHSVRTKVAMYKMVPESAAATANQVVATSADDALASFGAEPVALATSAPVFPINVDLGNNGIQ